MALASAVDLLEFLRQQQILEPDQLADLDSGFADAKAMCRTLIERGWLSPYQANLLLQGKGADLVLGSYLLLERLGEGGMGTVFKARHRNLGRIVALKLIRKERLANPDAVRRFRREIKAAAQLNHPNIVRAFDADEVGSTHLLVMEYVAGIDLAKKIRQDGPLPIAEACDYVRQAALGLQHAYEKGLVHRDIKPANLLLSAGTVKILDMGLARVHQAHDDSGVSSTMTQEGAVMGSPDYIAPEQALESHTVDIRADLYSLGCTLYQLLTGRVPFPTGTLLQKLNKHQFETPTPVEQLRPDVPPAVAAIVRKLMAKRPDDRYRTPAEVVAALEKTAGPQNSAAAARAAEPAATIPDHQAAVPTPLPSLGDTVTHAVAARKAQRQAEKRRWLVINAVGGGVLVVLLAVLGILFTRSRTPEPSPVAVNPPNPSGPAVPGQPAQPQSLFNGKDLDGWEVKDGPANAWIVRDGLLINNGDRGMLGTRKTYRDFTVQMEWRIQPSANSGVYLRVPAVGDPNFQSMEIQISDDKAVTIRSCGSIYNLVAPSRNAFKGAGEWNLFELTCRGEQLTLVFNGETVLNVDLAANPQLAARSKEGYIGLSGHTRQIEFRNIRIKDLTSGAAIPPGEGWRPLFTDQKLTGWSGLMPCWKMDGAEVIGSSSKRVPFTTYLCSEKKYRDFEVQFQVWLKGEKGNTGLQIRSELFDQAKFAVKGPQCDIGGAFWGCLYGQDFGGMMKKAPGEVVSKLVKPDAWNQFHVRCVGKHVTIRLNDAVTVDDEFPTMPDEGILAWQLHVGEPMQVVFRDAFIRELSAHGAAIPPPADGWLPLFSGKDLAGLRTVGVADDTFQVVNGEIRCSGKPNGYLVTEKSFQDFHLTFELKHTQATGNSGVLLYVQAPDKVWPQCIEGQATQMDMGTLFAVGGAKIGFVNGNPERATIMKPVGQWNVYEIISKKGRLTSIVNGIKISDLGGPLKEGRIGWQSEGTEVWFRNLRIRDQGKSD